MKKYKVAILGATGAVGREMMKVLAERDFPIEELHPLASARSVGQAIHWKGHDIPVEMACDEAFKGMDIVLGAAENDIAKQFAPAIVKAGAVFVDNSSAFRMDPDVPLIVPEINPEDVKKHKGIISNPNCTTIVSLVAINALNHDSPIESIVASSYQAVSGAPGCRLVDDLANKRYPMPLETSDQDLVFVGRIRDDLTSDNGLNIWCCGDQVRKGAATNAVQIAQLLIAE